MRPRGWLPWQAGHSVSLRTGEPTGWPLFTPRYDGAIVAGLYARDPDLAGGRQAIEIRQVLERRNVPAVEDAVRLVQRGVLELVVRRRRTDDAVLLELLDEIGAHAARVQKLLELDGGQLLELGLGVIDAALLANARANLAHDLLDVDGIGANI